MEINFNSPKIEKQCNSQKEAIRAFGPKVGKKLMLRMEQLRAVECMSDLNKLPHLQSSLRSHLLNPKKLGRFAVGVVDKWRIIFRPTRNPFPLKQDGGIDQEKVFEIDILSVEDYHD